jgi:CDP-diacylglycerol--glycerol-3-phosphate 3-phosphatidyltransferase
MPSVYQLKPAFQGLLRPFARLLARAGVTANAVTVLAALGSIAYGVKLYQNPTCSQILLYLPLWLFLRMALNALDGMLAREHNQKSALGAFLNELGDVIADTAIYLPFAVVPGVSPVLIVSLVLLASWSEMAGALALMVVAQRRYDGPMGKSDRAFFFGALGLGLGLGVPVGPWLQGLLTLVNGLLIVTIANRARGAIAEVNAR